MIFADDLFMLPFGGVALDRAAHVRNDATALATYWKSRGALVLKVMDHQLVSVTPTKRLDWVPATVFGDFRDDATFLGLHDDGHALFSVDVDHVDAGSAPVDEAGRFMNLRDVALTFDALDQSAAALAVALSTWHGRSRFCTRCGGATSFHHAGHSRHCSQCDREIFPRSDAAVIMLVRDGSHCVLGRRLGSPANRWSTLAGFVEAGESPEAAVYREVYEEVGLRVSRVRYRGSQPWPFPSSLMLAYEADASYQDLVLNEEHHEVRWFHRDDIAARIASGTFAVPSQLSAGGHLISEWLHLDA